MSDDVDHRQTPRVARPLIARYRSAAAGQTSWLMSPLRDFSSTGARFIAERAFPLGTILEVELLLPTAREPLTLTARVVRAVPMAGTLCEHGVTFETPDPATRQIMDTAIAHFLRKHTGSA